MTRGKGGFRVIVIGMSPGATELATGEAFSGQAGKRLEQWLIKAGFGAMREELFERIHFTSLVKCGVAQKNLPIAARHCFPFLVEQINIVQPRVALLLGSFVVGQLLNSALPISGLVGRVFLEQDFEANLMPTFPADCLLVPLPHPSPLGRLMNEPDYRAKVEEALSRARDHLEA